MRTRTIILGTFCCLLTCNCTNRQKRFLPETVQDPQISIIGGADTVTGIVIAEKGDTPDRDTAIYELPQCQLWYTKALPEEYKGKGIQMWTEHKVYGENAQAINVFVSNPTNIPFDFGRSWNLYVWNEKEWIAPGMKLSMIIWEDDLFIGYKAPLLYCFRFNIGEYYYLPKGKYQITKLFRPHENVREEVNLYAEFEVK